MAPETAAPAALTERAVADVAEYAFEPSNHTAPFGCVHAELLLPFDARLANAVNFAKQHGKDAEDSGNERDLDCIRHGNPISRRFLRFSSA